MGENIYSYRNRISINQPLTGRNRRGRWVDYRVWTDTAEEEERMCVKKSASEMNEFY
jgi:hypothetical protein